MSQFEDVVVIIPGITGSVLAAHDGARWDLSGGAFAKFLTSLGGSLSELELPTEDDGRSPIAPDGVQAIGLLNDLHLLPGLWRIDGYGEIQKRLRRLKLTEGENLRLFPYDWRRDNRAAALRLQAESELWLAEQRARGANDPRLVILAHSMGGLVSRYFLEVLGGWRHTRRLVTFGTPYRGSLEALNALSNGVHKPLVGSMLTRLVRSFPSVHQLLPVYPCIDDGEGNMVRVRAWPGGLPNVRPDLLSDAAEFHREIADAQAANAELDAYHDTGYSIHPVVGMAQQTMQSARMSGDRFEMLHTHEGEDLGGDGTVPFVSAFPSEWTDAADAMFLPTKHASMHNRRDGLAQVEGIVRGSSVDLSRFRSSARQDWVALDNDDLYEAGDVVFQVRTSGGEPVATLEPTEDGQPPVASEVTATGGAYQVVFRAVPVGSWRLGVETDEARCTDVLITADFSS